MKGNIYAAFFFAAAMTFAATTVDAKPLGTMRNGSNETCSVTSGHRPAGQKKGITKKGTTTIVSTRGVVKGVKGFAGDTPVKIYIEKGRITRIEPQPNQETPSVFARAEALLRRFIGKSVGEAQSMRVDAVSGATCSSKALVQTVKGGLKYYEDNR